MLNRYIKSTVEKSLELFPAVLLNGARQVGKSTLARQLVKDGKIQQYVSLDDITTLEAATVDPQGFIDQFKSNVVIDEIQRVPNLILAIKKNIDNHKQIGKFLLTGSANVLSYPNVKESLAGRMDIISLEGFSISEMMQQKQPSFISDLFSAKNIDNLAHELTETLNSKKRIEDQELNQIMFHSFFPEVALKQNIDYRNRWIASYITAYIERDIRDLSKIIDIVSFAKLLRLVSLRTGSLLNIKNLSIATGLDQRTVTRYVELLEISFQITLLNPWSSNLGKQHVKTPKTYINDIGLAGYFFGINDPKLIPNNPNYGALFEALVFAELRKSLVYNPLVNIFFYRNHQGVEVDFLISQGEAVIGIECKSSSTITAKDYKNLKFVQEEIKNNFLGIIIYRGDQVIKIDKNIIAVPFELLT